jgi:hypothetical protein
MVCCNPVLVQSSRKVIVEHFTISLVSLNRSTDAIGISSAQALKRLCYKLEFVRCIGRLVLVRMEAKSELVVSSPNLCRRISVAVVDGQPKNHEPLLPL